MIDLVLVVLLSPTTAYTQQGVRSLGIRDDVLMVVAAILVVLIAAADMHHLSFITGFVVGGIVQVYLHPFVRVLPDDKMPAPPIRPVQHMSYAIQAQPALAWREMALWAVFYTWALYMLISRSLLG